MSKPLEICTIRIPHVDRWYSISITVYWRPVDFILLEIYESIFDNLS